MNAALLPIKPQYTSATPMLLFQGQRHRALLLSHLQSAGPVQYDSLLAVSRIEEPDQFCLFVSLEQGAPGQPLRLGLHTQQGYKAMDSVGGTVPQRGNFLAFALFIVEKVLNDKLMPSLGTGKSVPVIEKPFREFYPESERRLKVHYFFAHRWLPAYVRADVARFFGYLERGEPEPTRFIQARFQIMEQELKLAPPPGPDGHWMTARRVSDLNMQAHTWLGTESNRATTEPAGSPAQRFTIAIVQMPAPEFMTHAYFVGLAAARRPLSGDSSPRPLRVFTLEKRQEIEGLGVLCEWRFGPARELTHTNYNVLIPVQAEAFLQAVGSRLSEAAPLFHVQPSLELSMSG